MNYMQKTKEELIELLQGFKNEAATARVEALVLAEKLQDALNAKVDRMGDNKPWKLVALSGAVGFVLGLLF